MARTTQTPINRHTRSQGCSRSLTIATLLILMPAFVVSAQAQDTQAAGTVFHDLDIDGILDAGEEGIGGIAVSNGTAITLTDDAGRWSLPADDDTILFVIKPRGWMTPVDENGVPRFYYIHKPNGSPELRYAGVEPTGKLPQSIDFPLYPQDEPSQFRALFFGDPQVSSQWEVDLLAHDVLDQIITAGIDAVMSFSLGDIAHDPLGMLEPVAEAMSMLRMPNYFVHGNHDQNYDAASDKYADETWERVFGPPWFSLNYGPVHFLVLDDVIWHPATDQQKAHLTAGISEEQIEFIRNDLALVPTEALVVYMFHIPVMSLHNKEQFLSLFDGYEHVFGVSAHWHHQGHFFLGEDDGWPGAEAHHHLVNVTSCGSWWGGDLDYYGIPETNMRDGAPNGYSIASFDGNEYSIEFVPARRPRDFQMRIWAPMSIAAEKATDVQLYVNVFAGSERSTVEMRLGEDTEWVALEMTDLDTDDVAFYQQEFKQALEQVGRYEGRRELAGPAESNHLWVGRLPANLNAGCHTINVRTTDMFGHTYQAARAIRVE